MKVFFVIVSFIALAIATSMGFDYSKPVPIHLLPQWQAQHPEMTKKFLAKGSGPTGRIIGGTNAAVGQFPHQVALNLGSLFGLGLCGGSLIHANWVVTAAHCLDIFLLLYVEVVLGANDRSYKNEAGQQRVYATRRISHAGYNSETFINDIALLKIPAANIGVNNNIKLIPLATDTTDTLAEQNAIVSGWGRPSDIEEDAVDILQFVNTLIITNEDCASVYGSASVQNTTICSQGASCNGDSGGPMKVGNLLAGIVSFGALESCADFPSAYTRVSHYFSWISQKTNGAV